jgi:hypothetical protein
MEMTIKRTVAWLAALLLVAALPAGAQSLTGTISGTIFDEGGGALPGVTVTMTGKVGSRTAVTDAQGGYRFLALDPGTYSVQAELTGFKIHRRQNIDVSIGSVVDVSLTLAVGDFSEAIEVVGEAPVVDVSSSKTDNSLSQDMLFNLPIRPANAAADLLNYLPGVNLGAAYGGDADTANALLLDGVDTRDPEGGSAWTFFAYNLVDEVQVSGLGAPAEYGAFQGAVINTITKSGGNNWGGLFEAYYTKDSLASDNVSDEVKTANPALAESAKINKYWDLTAQLSGPLIKDKLFFFVSGTYFTEEDEPTGPRTYVGEFSPRFATKLTFQPGPNDNFTAILQSDNYYIRGRAGQAALISTDEITNNEDSQGWNWGATWRHVFGSRTFAEVKYNGWTGFYDLNPIQGPPDQVPGHFDAGTGLYSDSQGWIYYADRGRHQVNASVSHFAEAFGQHDLKFGVEIERSRVRTRYGFGTLFYYDYAAYYPVGQYTAYTYGYDLEGRNQRESIYVQDSWKIGDRLTLNPGIRYDWVRGNPAGVSGNGPDGDSKIYDVKNLSVRFGFAFDLLGDNSTVLKGHYGRYYEGAFFYAWSSAIPGREPFTLNYYDPAGTDVVGPLGNTFTEYSSSPATPYAVDPDIKHPFTDEITFGLERALGNDIRLSLTGIWRKDGNLQGSVIQDARWNPVELPNDLTGGTITGYQWANPDESEESYLITNPDGFQYFDPDGNLLGTAKAERNYRGLMFVVDKRFSNRWQARVSYVLSKAEGTQDNDGFDTYGASSLYESPSRALINQEGRLTNDFTHEIKVYGTYQVPVIDVSVNLYYQAFSGRPYTPYQQYSFGDLGYPLSSGRRILLQPRGSERRDMRHLVDLRLEKFFPIGEGTDRIAVFLDCFNLFNNATVTGIQDRVPDQSYAGVDEPVLYGAPSGLVAPRQLQIGARWSF